MKLVKKIQGHIFPRLRTTIFGSQSLGKESFQGAFVKIRVNTHTHTHTHYCPPILILLLLKGNLISITTYSLFIEFPGSSDGKASVYNAGDPGSIAGSVRSPGEGNGNPLQYYCLENPMDREAW